MKCTYIDPYLEPPFWLSGLRKFIVAMQVATSARAAEAEDSNGDDECERDDRVVEHSPGETDRASCRKSLDRPGPSKPLAPS